MPRPLRIEFEDACYHVMNRGRGRQRIFHAKAYYDAFLKTLAEAHRRFGAILHAYCLMDNHYHLLIQTPNANVSRIMRHINGLYTQRYNRLKRTDGPLFRGRFKAILVDADNYLLALSRYIHRNPIDLSRPLVRSLENYRWSSYPAYVGKATAPAWLSREATYELLGKRNHYAAYRAYVEMGVDEEIRHFYRTPRAVAILGDVTYRQSVRKRGKKAFTAHEMTKIMVRPTTAQVVKAVSHVFAVNQSKVLKRQAGRQQRNLPRKLAMFLCQQRCDAKLTEIRDLFGVGHIGSVSNAIFEVKKLLEADKPFQRDYEKVLDHLNMIQ